MLLTQSILVDPRNRVIAFCGETKRLSLIHRMSEEISRFQQKVIISAPEFRKLSTITELVIGKDTTILLTQLQKEFEKYSVIHAGKEVRDDLIIGFAYPDLAVLKDRIPEHYFLLYDASNGHDQLFCERDQIGNWVEHAPWDQLVYFFNISYVDQALEEFSTTTVRAIHQKYPDETTLSQEILIDYFTNPTWGMGEMFRQNWQTVLFIAGVENIRLENRAIQLARALQRKGVEHIVIGNMESLTVWRIPPGKRDSDNN